MRNDSRLRKHWPSRASQEKIGMSTWQGIYFLIIENSSMIDCTIRKPALGYSIPWPSLSQDKALYCIQKGERAPTYQCFRDKGFRGLYFIWRFIFSSLGLLPACMHVHHMYSVPTEARRRHQIPLKPELQMVVSHRVVLGIKPWSSAIAEPSFQSLEQNLSEIASTWEPSGLEMVQAIREIAMTTMSKSLRICWVASTIRWFGHILAVRSPVLCKSRVIGVVCFLRVFWQVLGNTFQMLWVDAS